MAGAFASGVGALWSAVRVGLIVPPGQAALKEEVAHLKMQVHSLEEFRKDAEKWRAMQEKIMDAKLAEVISADR